MVAHKIMRQSIHLKYRVIELCLIRAHDHAAFTIIMHARNEETPICKSITTVLY